MLNKASDEHLDLIDQVIFDASSPSAVRREALAFFCDHTEGFEDSNDNDAVDEMQIDDRGREIECI